MEPTVIILLYSSFLVPLSFQGHTAALKCVIAKR